MLEWKLHFTNKLYKQIKFLETDPTSHKHGLFLSLDPDLTDSLSKLFPTYSPINSTREKGCLSHTHCWHMVTEDAVEFRVTEIVLCILLCEITYL